MNEIIEKAENDFLGDAETTRNFIHIFDDVENLFYFNEEEGIKNPENVLLYERLKKIRMKYSEIYREKDRLEKIEHDRMRNEFLNTVVECGCGSKIKNRCLYRHKRSKKHIAFMNSQTFENQEEETEILEEGTVKCCCGSKTLNILLPRHERSKKHIAFMNSQI